MTLTEDQRRRLPRYALEEITRLERDLASAKRQVAEMCGDEPTGCYFYPSGLGLESEKKSYIPRRSSVRFTPDPGKPTQYFDVKLTQDGNLAIHVDEWVAALPGATNTLTLKRGVKP